ncbi:MAG: hypothetical protein KGQ70_06595, partial [Alphaproteobacteria bacterium]|nr:hypothetical protein [Alphaproteobacteria bacterium]
SEPMCFRVIVGAVVDFALALAIVLTHLLRLTVVEHRRSKHAVYACKTCTPQNHVSAFLYMIHDRLTGPRQQDFCGNGLKTGVFGVFSPDCGEMATENRDYLLRRTAQYGFPARLSRSNGAIDSRGQGQSQ